MNQSSDWNNLDRLADQIFQGEFYFSSLTNVELFKYLGQVNSLILRETASLSVLSDLFGEDNILRGKQDDEEGFNIDLHSRENIAGEVSEDRRESLSSAFDMDKLGYRPTYNQDGEIIEYVPIPISGWSISILESELEKAKLKLNELLRVQQKIIYVLFSRAQANRSVKSSIGQLLTEKLNDLNSNLLIDNENRLNLKIINDGPLSKEIFKSNYIVIKPNLNKEINLYNYNTEPNIVSEDDFEEAVNLVREMNPGMLENEIHDFVKYVFEIFGFKVQVYDGTDPFSWPKNIGPLYSEDRIPPDEL